MNLQVQQKQEKIKAVLDGVDYLKPLPTSVTKALKLMEDPNSQISQVASAISVDQALAARILKVVNSAYYGFAYPATNLHEAITRLGFRRIKSVLFTASYSTALGRRVASYNLGNGELWQHSVAAAMLAQKLAEKLHFHDPDEAYIGGLLHDIGKLVLDQHFKFDWNRLLVLAMMHKLPLIDAEEQLLGMNHAQIGAEIARRWSLPEVLVEAIGHHHAPLDAETAPELTSLVHVADVLCLRLGIGLAHTVFLPEPQTEAMELLKLDDDIITEVMEAQREVIESSLNIQTKSLA